MTAMHFISLPERLEKIFASFQSRFICCTVSRLAGKGTVTKCSAYSIVHRMSIILGLFLSVYSSLVILSMIFTANSSRLLVEVIL